MSVRKYHRNEDKTFCHRKNVKKIVIRKIIKYATCFDSKAGRCKNVTEYIFGDFSRSIKFRCCANSDAVINTRYGSGAGSRNIPRYGLTVFPWNQCETVRTFTAERDKPYGLALLGFLPKQTNDKLCSALCLTSLPADCLDEAMNTGTMNSAASTRET